MTSEATEPQGATGGRGPHWSRWAPLIVIAGVFTVVLAVFPGVFIGESFFYSDFHLAFQPLRSLLGQSLAKGLPLWNPHLDHGQPFLGSPFSAALYPPNWLFGLARPDSGRLLTLLTIFHLLWGSAGTWLLLRRRGMSLSARFAGALLFSFCGMTLSGSYMTLLCLTVAWSPWVLLAVDRAQSGRPGGIPVLGLAVGMQILCGDPFMVASTLLGAVLHSGLCEVEAQGGIRVAGRRALKVAMGYAMGILATSPFLWAAARHAGVSRRSTGLPTREIFEYSLHPLSAMNLAFPGIFGDAFLLDERSFIAYGIHDGRLPLFPSLYFGGLALSFACAAVILGARKVRIDAVWFLILGVLAVGRFLPFHESLLLIPGMSSTRYPLKWLLGAMLPLALLAAQGLDRVALVSRNGNLLGIVRKVFLFALAVPVSAFLFVYLGGDGFLAQMYLQGGDGAAEAANKLQPVARDFAIRGAWNAAVPVVGAALAVLLLIRKKRFDWIAPLFASFVSLDAVLANRGLAPTVPDGFYTDPPAVVLALRGREEPVTRVWVDCSSQATNVRTIFPARLKELAQGVRLQRERVDGYVGTAYGLSIAFSADLAALGSRSYLAYREAVESAPPRERAILLRIANVSHVISTLDRSGPDLQAVQTFHGFTQRPLQLYRVASPLPRVRMVDALRVHTGVDGLLSILSKEPADFSERYAFLDRAVVPVNSTWVFPKGQPGPATRGPSKVTVKVDEPSRLEVEVCGPPGFLVVSDSWAESWKAAIDGRPAPILPVNLTFRAVPIPDGSHSVDISYHSFLP